MRINADGGAATIEVILEKSASINARLARANTVIGPGPLKATASSSLSLSLSLCVCVLQANAREVQYLVLD